MGIFFVHQFCYTKIFAFFTSIFFTLKILLFFLNFFQNENFGIRMFESHIVDHLTQKLIKKSKVMQK